MESQQWFYFGFWEATFSYTSGKYFIKIGKIRAKIHEIGKIKAIFGLGMTPIYGLKNGQIKSLVSFKILNSGFILKTFTHVYASSESRTSDPSIPNKGFSYLFEVGVRSLLDLGISAPSQLKHE